MGNILHASRANLEGAVHVEVWYKCLYDAPDLDGGDRVRVYCQAAIQGAILRIGYVFFGSSATKGLDQVKLLVDSKKAVLNFYVIFINLDLIAEIAS
ncbi:hypothetical protein RO3G_11112 [Rhizopus delemar RA 99-880]|uniref:Uncharacterized protein n=1 Tax=Rhizopus delemar (strain RA 99-880 / ATCC MYA-4621 / FGSC 9543 / NRRL 43880) TaxID=246409 RepID=I1CD71_RHIO9|nr:hypothetical protein RO3G_11112 [Rhizopus delemar RA 99-880]|eukprot:EIE86401.1 hypothetical protein RO3G_11112 [Rhizopus delemar RA 99-880]